MANLRLHSLNDVKLVGRLTRAPEVRYTTQGTPVARLRVAVGRRFRDRNSGEWREEVAFVPCTVWRDNAERCGQRLKKGSPLFIEGRLRSREWETKEGQKRSDLEVEVNRVQFLEVSGEAGPSASEPSDSEDAGESEESGPSNGDASRAPSAKDEVPF